MIFDDFFCNSPRPSYRISWVSLFPPYPACSIIPAAAVETICHRFASPCFPSDRLGCTLRPACRSVSRADERYDWACYLADIAATVRYRYAASRPARRRTSSPHRFDRPLLPACRPALPCRGAGRRPFPRICVDNVNCPIYIYDLPSVCYSIGVEREQTPNERTAR